MNIPYNHIIQLKYLPKHGQDETDITKDDLLGDKVAQRFTDAQQKLATTIQNNTGVLDSYVNVFNKLTTAVAGNQQEISKRIGVAQLFSKSVQQEVKNLTFLEQRNASLNKTLGLSSAKSGELANEIDKIASSMGIGGGQARTYIQQFQQIAPLQSMNIATNNDLATSLFTVQQALTDQLGITPEAANAIQLYGNSLGGSVTDNVEGMYQIAMALEQQSGLAGAAKAIFQDIGSLGADIQFQFGRVPGSLEKAVLQARMLGTDFNTIAKAGDKVLDIENSINDELEYQLLSGRRLTDQSGKSLTAALREATVRGDAAAAAEAMQQIIDQEGETLKTNLFARQQMSQLLGVSEDKLMRMVQQNEMLGTIGGDAMNIFNEDTPAPTNVSLLGARTGEGDTRTSEEIRAEQTQNAILTKLLADLQDQSNEIADTRKNLLSGDLKETLDSFITSADEIVKGQQPLFLLADKLTTLLEPVNELTKFLPGVGNILVGGIDKAIEAIGLKKIGNLEATIEGNGTITVGSITGTKEMKDGVIDPGGNIVSTDPADFLLATKDPAGLANAVGGGSTTVQYSGPSADDIASAVASAVSGITVVTNIEDIMGAIERNNEVNTNINAIT